MKNTIETTTFSENPFSIVIKFVVCGIIGFVILAIVLSIFRLPPDNKGNETTEFFLLMILGAIALISLALFLIQSFAQKKTVTCDSMGFDIYTTNFWNTFYESGSYLWSEVTDTNINEEYVDKNAKAILIDVEVKGESKRLLAQHLSSPKTFSELLDFINQSTPQLNYVWEKTSDFGDRQVIVEVQNFSKVARI